MPRRKPDDQVHPKTLQKRQQRAQKKALTPVPDRQVILNYLEVLKGFDPDLVDTLKGCDLSLFNNDVKDSPSIIYPRLLRAEECWRKPLLTSEDLLRQTLKCYKESRYTCYRNGEKSKKDVFDQALCQHFIKANHNDPVFLTDLILPSMAQFETPSKLSRFVDPHLEQSPRMHLTPKYSVVDFHIDFGTDGLSTVLEECVKLFVLYPPSPENLSLMKETESQMEKITRIGPRLRGGIIIKMTSLNALYIPAGWIHATLTTEGLYLASKDFTTPQSAIPFSRFLSLGLERSLDKKGQEVSWDWFADCLHITLQHPICFSRAIEAWVYALDQIVTWARAHPNWAAKAKRTWTVFLESSECQSQQACFCEKFNNQQETFLRHLQSTHLSFLFLEEQPQQSASQRKRKSQGEDMPSKRKRSKGS